MSVNGLSENHKNYLKRYITNKITANQPTGLNAGITNFIKSLNTNLTTRTGRRSYTKLRSDFNAAPQNFLNSQGDIFVKMFKSNTYLNSTSGRRVPKKYNNELKYPWYLIHITNGPPYQLRFEKVNVPGFARSVTGPAPVTWELKWNYEGLDPANMGVFPLAKTSTRNNLNNSVFYEGVGRYCAQQTTSFQRCSAPKNSLKWEELFPNSSKPNKSILKKNGVRGISVHELTLAISRSNPKLKRRRYYIDLKRTGDWGEIFAVYIINTDPNIAVMNPGNLRLSREFARPWSQDIQNTYNNLRNNAGHLFFLNACFWSKDRPACKCAQLMGIDLVYQRVSPSVSGYIKLDMNNLVNELPVGPIVPKSIITVNNERITLYTAESVLSILHHTYINDPLRGDVYNYPLWLQIMAIIDTAHDFGHGTRTYTKSRNAKKFAADVRSLMVGLYSGSRDINVDVPPNSPVTSIKMTHLIHNIFQYIADIEDAIGNDLLGYIINKKSTFSASTNKNSTFKIYDPKRQSLSAVATTYNNYNSLEELLAAKNACIVFDTGSLVENVRHRLSLLSPKFSNSG